jgi:hypothetical protein
MQTENVWHIFGYRKETEKLMPTFRNFIPERMELIEIGRMQWSRPARESQRSLMAEFGFYLTSCPPFPCQRYSTES